MIKPPIIVFRLGSIGDTIFALPCFHAIRAKFIDRRIILLTNVPVSGKAAPLMAVLGHDGQFVDDVIEYPILLRSVKGVISLAQAIRATGADTLVYLMPKRSWKQASRDWLFLNALCGIKKIICFPRSPDLRDVRVDPITGEIEREAARLIRTCSAVGEIDIEDRSNWDLKLTDQEVSKAREVISPLEEMPFVAVNMGGKVAEKDWGLANWQDLRGRLSAFSPLGVLVIGAQDESGRGDIFVSDWDGPAVNACGVLSPRESGAAIAEASLFIGHDSGPLPLAAAVGTPAIGLFGAYNRPKQWHPIGQTVRIIHQMEGLDKITPHQIMVQVKELLADREFTP